MKKKNNTVTIRYSWIYFIFFAILLVIGVRIFFINNHNTYSTTLINQETKDQDRFFTAKYLKFQIKVPEKYKIEDGYSTVILKKDNKVIVIGKTETDYPNINDYITDLSSKNNRLFKIREDFILNKSNIIKSDAMDNNGKIIETNIYFIYNNYRVYTLSTTFQELQSDLDSIVKSFVVLP